MDEYRVLENLKRLEEELMFVLIAKTGEPAPRKYFSKFKFMERNTGMISKFNRHIRDSLRNQSGEQSSGYFLRLERFIRGYCGERYGEKSTLEWANLFSGIGDNIRKVAIDNKKVSCLPSIKDIGQLSGFVRHVRENLEKFAEEMEESKDKRWPIFPE